MKKLFAMILLFCLLACAGYAEEADAWALPLDMEYENPAANPAGFTDTSYHDDSLDIQIEEKNWQGVKCFVAHIKVKSPTQLRTAYSMVPELPSVMGKALNAVLIINGEFFVQRTRDTFIYRQGEMLRNQPDPAKDVLIIDRQGDFHIFMGKDKADQIKEYMQAGGTVVNAFSFGPALVKDGETVRYREDYFFYPLETEWRSFIGQEGPLSYVFAVIQGARQRDEIRFAETLGLQQAYNLDGGNSAVMLFNRRYVGDKRAANEREQSDIVYVVSAVGNK